MMPALLDHIWQSTVFAVGILLLMPLFRNNSAAVRFRLWFAASLKFLFPFSLLADAGHHLFVLLTPAAFVSVLSAIRPAAEPFSLSAPYLAGPAHFSWPHAVAAIWALGTMSVVGCWFWRWLPLREALLAARELPVAAPVPVKLVTFPREPGLFGIWHPVVLLPECVVQGLSGSEIAAILAHEFSHLRRRDNLLSAAHMLVEAIFWFHPLVWWIGARLVEERERACDESVLAEGNNPQAYAETILKVCRLCVPSPLACAAGISSSDLDARVVAIMAGRSIEDMDPAKQMLLAFLAAIVIAMPLTVGALESAPARDHGTAAIISVSSALLHLPSVTIEGDQASLDSAGKIAQTHDPGRHRHLNVRPDKIEIVLDAADISGEAAAPPRQAADIPEPAPVRTATVDYRTAVATADAKPAPVAAVFDEIVCRPPQQLPASRFLGPRTCRPKALWDQYRRNALDIAPDGVHVVPADSPAGKSAFACPVIAGRGYIPSRFDWSVNTLSC